MAMFCVKRYGSNDCVTDFPSGYKHYCSLFSPDLSVYKDVNLPFAEDELVDGGSCGAVLYFYDQRGNTSICTDLAKEEWNHIQPPEALTSIRLGWYRSCGVSYDAKSGDYKVIRIYSMFVVNEAGEEVLKYYFDLFSVLRNSAKYITEPTRKCCIKLGAGLYVGEAGSGSGSCYWAACLCGNVSSHDPLKFHVLSFDFATESFDQFPLPATANGTFPIFELVECRGSLGVLAYWFPLDEFSIEPDQFSSDLSIKLFVRNGKGTSWDLLYYFSIPHAYRPLGLIDRSLILAARPSDHQQLMVYNLASKTLKRLDIKNCLHRMSVICYGDKRRKKKKKKGKGKGKGKEK